MIRSLVSIVGLTPTPSGLSTNHHYHRSRCCGLTRRLSSNWRYSSSSSTPPLLPLNGQRRKTTFDHRSCRAPMTLRITMRKSIDQQRRDGVTDSKSLSVLMGRDNTTSSSSNNVGLKPITSSTSTTVLSTQQHHHGGGRRIQPHQHISAATLSSLSSSLQQHQHEQFLHHHDNDHHHHHLRHGRRRQHRHDGTNTTATTIGMIHDDGHRETMRLFLDSLHFVVATTANVGTILPSSSSNSRVMPNNNNNNSNTRHNVREDDEIIVWRDLMGRQRLRLVHRRRRRQQQHHEEQRGQQRRMILPREHPQQQQPQQQQQQLLRPQHQPTLSPELRTVSSSSASSAAAATATVSVRMVDMVEEMIMDSDNNESSVLVPLVDGMSVDETSHTSSSAVQSDPSSSNNNTTDDDQPQSERQRRRDEVLEQLSTAIKKGYSSKAIYLFRLARDEKFLLTKKVITNLFYVVSEKDPLGAHEVLQYYNSHPSHNNNNNNNGADPTIQPKVVSMYKRMCKAVGLLRPLLYPDPSYGQMIVESLMEEIGNMPDDVKMELYPILVVTLISQRCSPLGPYAGMIYDTMAQNGYPMKLGWLVLLLSMSKYNRQEDLPYHDVLGRLVAMGGQPHPMCSIPAIVNMFPYTDADQMCLALSAWLDFEADQKSLQYRLLHGEYGPNGEYNNNNNNNHRTIDTIDDGSVVFFPFEDRKLDLATLEMISMGAARAGSSKLILLVWDILEHCEYTPTETIYENTIIAFVTDEKGVGIQQAFTAMEAMKEDGYPISRALIRSCSTLMRSQVETIDNALQVLLDDQDVLVGRGKTIGRSLMSLESLNVVMSSYAERGDTERTMSILDIMKENGIQPNDDSYSFAIESLGKEVYRRKKRDDTSFLYKSLEIVNTILTMMEDSGVSPSSDVIRQYVELLCLTGEVETATSVVESYIADSSTLSRVNSKTIYRVALANAERGDVRRATELASKMSEHIPILHRKIRSKAMRLAALEAMDERHGRSNDSDERSH